MAKLSKKQIKEIDRITFVHEVIKEMENDTSHLIAETHWVDTNPEMWNSEEKELYDKMITLEYKIKDEILSIVGGKNI